MLKFKVVVEIPKYETIVEAESKQEALSKAEESFCDAVQYADNCITLQEV